MWPQMLGRSSPWAYINNDLLKSPKFSSKKGGAFLKQVVKIAAKIISRQILKAP
jgi:hypothetical protein